MNRIKPAELFKIAQKPFLALLTVSGMLLLPGCSSEKPAAVISMQQSGLRMETTVFSWKASETTVQGMVKVTNQASVRKNFYPHRLWIRTNHDRYRTIRKFTAEIMRDYAPIELSPGDSTTVKVYWFTGSAFDSTGMTLEYNDFNTAGRVRTKTNTAADTVRDTMQ